MSENEHVLSGLLRKRAEIAGELQAAQAAVRQHIIDLDAVDATIRLFSPNIELEDIRPKPLPARHAAYKGEVSRIIFDTLRERQRPMTSEELAQHVMATRDLNSADKGLLRMVTKRVASCLRHYRNRGVLQSAMGPGNRVLWKTVA